MVIAFLGGARHGQDTAVVVWERLHLQCRCTLWKKIKTIYSVGKPVWIWGWFQKGRFQKNPAWLPLAATLPATNQWLSFRTSQAASVHRMFLGEYYDNCLSAIILRLLTYCRPCVIECSMLNFIHIWLNVCLTTLYVCILCHSCLFCCCKTLLFFVLYVCVVFHLDSWVHTPHSLPVLLTPLLELMPHI